MVGITSYGAYVPMQRLSLGAIAGGGRQAAGGSGERAVAYFDEDSITMAVAAGADCLKGFDRAKVGGVFFASTSSPYREKQASAVIAKALDLPREVITADFGDSLRAGTMALRSAVDAVTARSAGNVLVIAADCRLAAPRSPLERNLGDAAAAVLVGEGEVAAIVDARHSLSEEIIDLWRTETDTYVKSWEDRFVVEEGYLRIMRDAVHGLLKKAGVEAKDLAKALLYGPDARSHAALAKQLGLDAKTQIQDPLFGQVGNSGAAMSLLLLVAALETARGSEKLLLASYGDGADAYLLTTTDRVGSMRDRRGLSWHLSRRTELSDYDKYLRYRNLEASANDRRAGAGVSATVHFRDRNEDISFHAQRCRKCGQEQFPFQRVCFTCFARDQFEEVRLSDREGKVMSYTFDFFAGSPDPPMVVSMVEAQGGSRLYLQMTDVSAKELRLDLPVEFTFRKIHEYGGTPNYFWKCTPVRQA